MTANIPTFRHDATEGGDVDALMIFIISGEVYANGMPGEKAGKQKDRHHQPIFQRGATRI